MNSRYENFKKIPDALKRLPRAINGMLPGEGYPWVDPSMDRLLGRYSEIVSPKNPNLKVEVDEMDSKLEKARPGMIEAASCMFSGMGGAGLAVHQGYRLLSLVANSLVEGGVTADPDSVFRSAAFATLGVTLFGLGFIVGPAICEIRYGLDRKKALEQLEVIRRDIKEFLDPTTNIDLGVQIRNAENRRE